LLIDESTNHPLCGGNKIRKLEYILKDTDQYSGYLTYGSKYSSHCLATAYMARKNSKKARLLITDKKSTDIGNYPNLKLAKLLGAEILFIGQESLHTKIEIEKNKCINFLWIKGGGHELSGLEAYKDWFIGVIKKCPSITKYNQLILPFGTGTTALGIAKAVFESNLDIKIKGISVARTKDICLMESKKIVSDDILNILEIDDRFSGKYGIFNSGQKLIRVNFQKEYGILPDPIYNVRVAQYIHEEKVEKSIILNTGGQLNNLLEINYSTGGLKNE
jgi:1-aminocyclopropane-1-carboxylate deaminase/D-cysteine desulfhydrase-like pyridoxal-dependent ACC family enzyme